MVNIMRQYQILLILSFIIHQVVGSINVWATKEMVSRIIQNGHSYRAKKCPDDYSESTSIAFDKFKIVENGQHHQYGHFTMNNITIPPKVNIVSIKWNSLKKHKYMIQLKFKNSSIIYTPTLNIPFNGTVPNQESDIQLNLICTGKRTGKESIEIKLIISALDKSKRTEPIPIHGTLHKECLSKRDMRREEKFLMRCKCAQKKYSNRFCRCVRKCSRRNRHQCCVQKCQRNRSKFKGKHKGIRNRKRCRKRRKKRRRRKGKRRHKKKRSNRRKRTKSMKNKKFSY